MSVVRKKSMSVAAAFLAACATALAQGPPPPGMLPPGGAAGSAASHGNVSIYPSGQGPMTGLENARIFVPGTLNTPGRWDIRGDGSGPMIVNGEVILPKNGVYGTDPRQFPSSAEILKQVEEQQAAAAPPPPPPPPPIQLRDLTGVPPAALLEQSDSRDLSTRGSALTALGGVEKPPEMRLAAIKKLLLALDDDDLRIVKLAVLALGKLNTDSATAKLISLLNLEDPEMLILVSKTLGQMGKRKALPALQSVANLPDPEVAGAASAAIAQIEQASAAPAQPPAPTKAAAQPPTGQAQSRRTTSP